MTEQTAIKEKKERKDKKIGYNPLKQAQMRRETGSVSYLSRNICA